MPDGVRGVEGKEDNGGVTQPLQLPYGTTGLSCVASSGSASEACPDRAGRASPTWLVSAVQRGREGGLAWV